MTLYRATPCALLLVFGYNEKNAFGLLRFDTEAEDPSVTYEVVDIDGITQESFQVHRSELTD